MQVVEPEQPCLCTTVLKHQVGSQIEQLCGWGQLEDRTGTIPSLIPLDLPYPPCTIHVPGLSLLPEPVQGGRTPVALAGHQAPVQLHRDAATRATLEEHVVAGHLVEARAHLQIDLTVAEGLHRRDSRPQVLSRHEQVNIAQGAQGDTGIEGRGQSCSLQDDHERPSAGGQRFRRERRKQECGRVRGR